MGRFDRRVAVITGAARGIGFGIATRFASEGASIAILDLDEAAAQEAAGRLELTEGARAIGVGCDVVEVSPPYDGPGQQTALAAANVLFELLALRALA